MPKYWLGLGSLAGQALDGGRSLRAHALPVRQAVLRQAQALFAFNGAGVVKANALDEAAIAAHALVSHDDAVERAGLGATTGKTDNDH